MARFCSFCRVSVPNDEPTCPRDGHPSLEEHLDLIPPDVESRFEIVEPFARGQSGTLYLADERQTARRGVLKILHPATQTQAMDRVRLKRELIKQATMQHAALCLPYVMGESGNQLWLFREWLEGISLRVHMKRTGPLPLPEAIHIAAQVTEGLESLHHSGLLHRDLKPGHILVRPQPSGLAKISIIDAGVAARVVTDKPFEIVGTAHYVSPEQAGGRLVSFRSDLYALGNILYEMLAGKPPFDADTTEALLRAHTEQLPPVAPGDLPPGITSLLAALLEKEPRKRPFSAQQVRKLLDPFLPQAGASAVETTQSFGTPAHGISRDEVMATVAATPPQTPGTLRPPRRNPTRLGIGDPAAFTEREPGAGRELGFAKTMAMTPPPFQAPAPNSPAVASAQGNADNATVPIDIETDSGEIEIPHGVRHDAALGAGASAAEMNLAAAAYADDDAAAAAVQNVSLPPVVPTVQWRELFQQKKWLAVLLGLILLGVVILALAMWFDSKTPAPLPTSPSVKRAAPAVAPPVKEPAPVETEPAKPAEEPEEEVVMEEEEGEPEKSAKPAKANRAARAEPRAATAHKAKASPKTKKSGGSSGSSFESAREDALAHYKAGHFKEAAKSYQEATRLNPSHAGSWAGLGGSRLAAGDARGAVAAYKKAVDLSPSTSGFHAALGRAYLATGDKKRAISSYKKALELNPKNAAARTALSKLQ